MLELFMPTVVGIIVSAAVGALGAVVLHYYDKWVEARQQIDKR